MEGKGLSNDGAWSYAERPPLISFQLAATYALTGASTAAGRWSMVFVSALTAPVLFLTAMLLFGRRYLWALAVGGFWVVYPPSIYYGSQVLTESMGVLLSVAGLGAFLRASKSRFGLVLAGLTGILWGLATLNRSAPLLLPFAVLVAQVCLGRRKTSYWGWSLKSWSVGLLLMALTLSPWIVRNYIALGAFVPATSRLGDMLWMCNGTLDSPLIQSGRYDKNWQKADRARRELGYEFSNELERHGFLRRLALKEIADNWRLLPTAVSRRAINFWTVRPDPYDPQWTRNDWIMLAVWTPVLVAFAVSLFVCPLHQTWPVLAMIFYAFALTLPFWGTPRFRYPVDPLIVLCSAMGVQVARDWLSGNWVRMRSTARA